MYITAHRVRSRTGDTGINAFLHLHDDRDYGLDWSKLDVRRVTEQEPGRLFAERLDVVPGGNHVLAYLDVAAPDGTPLAAVAHALQHMRTAVRDTPQPWSRSFPGMVYVRFGAVIGLEGAEEIEFEALSAALQDLYKAKAPATWLDQPPVVVRVSQEGEQILFRLDPASAPRVRGRGPVPIPVGVVRIDLDTLEAFTAQYGDVVPHVLPVVTGMGLDELRLLGGVKVIRDTDGTTLWAWPRRGGGA